MDVTYRPEGINNFHNARSIRLRVTGTQREECYLLSPSQVRRLRKHFCGGGPDCRCPHGGIVLLDIDSDGHDVCGLPIRYCQAD